MADIIIKSNDWPRETHPHFCPQCRKIKVEPNDLCRKSLVGMNLDRHTYICLHCAQDLRYRLGSDWLEALVGAASAALATHVIPQRRIAEREEREAQTNPEIAAVLEASKKI